MSKPRYLLVADGLRAQIERGEYSPGDRLPTKPEMMNDFGVALATLDRGLEILRDEGLIDTFHGVGTFVKERQPHPASIEEEIADLKDRVAQLETVRDRVAQLETQVLDLYGNLALPNPAEHSRPEAAG